LIGLRLRDRFPKLRWIADLRDPWTDIYFAKDLHMGAAAQRRNAQWEERVMKQADVVVVVGPSMERSLVERYGDEVGRKIHVIPNGYDQVDIDRAGDVRPAKGSFRITYVGTMAASYDPRAFFASVRSAISSVPNIELRFVGSVSEEVKVMAAEAGIGEQCSWIPPVDHDAALREMKAANALLLVIPDSDGAEKILTGKLFEYLGVRRPIIGLGPANGDAAAIIRECAAGEMFERKEEERMTAWIVERSKATGQEVGNGVQAKYDRRTAAARLAGLVR
jgi:glycosyltransferase involved in cell wall biosynthesis